MEPSIVIYWNHKKFGPTTFQFWNISEKLWPKFSSLAGFFSTTTTFLKKKSWISWCIIQYLSSGNNLNSQKLTK